MSARLCQSSTCDETSDSPMILTQLYFWNFHSRKGHSARASAIESSRMKYVRELHFKRSFGSAMFVLHM